jgi:5-methylcytosine-specific restriction endonuclease McrA
MSNSYISAELRRRVSSRADRLCEYCLIHEEDTFFGCQVDHIISEKHGGATDEDNLAYACLFCNRFKGSDVGSLKPGTNELVRFFNPRSDRWTDHFALDSDGITLIALTDVGEATSRILGFNREERLLEREALKKAGRYPTEAAKKRFENRAD